MLFITIECSIIIAIHSEEPQWKFCATFLLLFCEQCL